MGSGIVLIVLFALFATHNQNDGNLPTIYQFSYGCAAKIHEYTAGYSYRSEEHAAERCNDNHRLALLTTSFGVSGVILLLYSTVRKVSR